jgi:hypothetical protein
MKRNKVLYLCPEVPVNCNTGGKVAFQNHLNIFIESGLIIDAVFLNVETNKETIPDKWIHSLNNVYVFNRKIKKIDTVSGKLKFLLDLFFNNLPRFIRVRQNKELQLKIKNLIVSENYDSIIFDHLSSFGFLSSLKEILNTNNVFYISHNIEFNILKQLTVEGTLLKRILYNIEYYKTKKFELQVFNIVDKIITISSNDYNNLKQFISENKLKNIPELLNRKSKRWEYKKSNTIFFVGGTNYYPNFDAVNWIVSSLLPQLVLTLPDIKCVIIGKSDNFNKKGLLPNIKFTGIISDSELEGYYTDSNLFISPIVLGSGIKIKVLTAMSYSTPIIGSLESFHGIDLNENNYIINNRDIELWVSTIKKLWNIKSLMNCSEYFDKNLSILLDKNKKNWKFLND